MNQKCASIHILMKNRKADLPLIVNKILKERKTLSLQDMVRNIKDVGGGDEGMNLSKGDIEAFMRLVVNSAYASQRIVTYEKFLSVYDEGWEWDATQKKAQEYSRELNLPAFAYSLLEDGSLRFSAYASGDVVLFVELSEDKKMESDSFKEELTKLYELLEDQVCLSLTDGDQTDDRISGLEDMVERDLGLFLSLDENLPVKGLEEAVEMNEACLIRLDM